MHFYLSLLRRWSVQLGLFAMVTGSAIAITDGTLAQVLPDNSLGTENTAVTNAGNIDTISGGATRGGNLFHSFEQFSVQNGRTAQFDNAASIQNIISRVTGGSVSNIDGTIAARGTANLFLLNPNGIVFGPNSRLNIGGSFIGTSARSIDFADGTQFSATPGSGAPLLTVNVPLGLQFGTSAGNITNRAGGDGLAVQPGRTLGLVGGNVSLDGGNLSAAGGRIELGAVAAPGVVGLNPDSTGFRFSFPTDLALGDISLLNDILVDVRAGGGGSIAVNARNLNVTAGSELAAGIGTNQGAVGAVAGDIDINTQGTISIDGQNQQGFVSGFFNTVGAGGTGNSGNINVRARSLSMTNRGRLTTSVFGQGNAGNIEVQAQDSIALNNSLIVSNLGSRQATTPSTGNTGSIRIRARTVSLVGAQIQASYFPNARQQGNPGIVSLETTDSISLAGRNNDNQRSAIFADVEAGAVANGNNIQISAPIVSLNDALLNANSAGQGNAGNASITASDRISLDNNSSVRSALLETGSGRGGNITINSRSLSLSNGAELSTPTLGQGDAGNIQIDTTEDITASGGSSMNTFSSSVGNSGNVNITAGGLVSFDGVRTVDLPGGVFSFLNSIQESQSDRRGGDINVRARSLSLTNGAALTTESFGGNAGNVEVSTTESVIASGGSRLSAASFGRGDGGNVTITAGDRVSLDGSDIFSNLEATASGAGGNINVRARSLSLTNGSGLGTSTLGQGNAGSISLQIDDTATLANDSEILSNVAVGAVGDGGTIDLNAGSLSLTDGAQILAFVERTFNDGRAGGRGNGGRVTIDLRDTFSASGSSRIGERSGVSTFIGTGAVGNGGSIDLRARTLSLDNGATMNASTFGQGNAGSISLQIDDTAALTNDSFIFSSVAAGAVGNGGTIDLNAGSLSLTGGSQVVAGVDPATDDGLAGGRGNGGKIVIDVRDAFNASGKNSRGNPSGVFAAISPGAVGDSGTINFKAGSLSLTDGGQLSTRNFGQGNAGNIDIAVDDAVTFAGVNQGTRSGVFSSTSGIGNGGDINISAGILSLTDGAQINAVSEGRGDAGDITINARSGIAIDGFNQRFPSAIGSSVEGEGTGQGGNITIDVRNGSLSLTSGGLITAGTFSGLGDAGNIDIEARNLYLDRAGSEISGIFATSASGNGGNIRLQASRSVRLRNGSGISTSAGGTGQPGNGGNITIDSPLVIANRDGNNDITANAFLGSGGRIEINARSIFGLTPRSREELQSLLGTDTPTAEDFLNALDNSPSNDVAAISLTDPTLSGTVSFNAADIDPSRDLVELPTGLVNASERVAAGCPSGVENRFAVTGRGGLPPAPGDKLSTDTILTDWATLQTPETGDRAAMEPSPEIANATPTPIIEANTWQFDAKGEIVLIANASNTPNGFGATPTSCSGS